MDATTRPATVTVTLAVAQPWSVAWLADGGAWPTYVLEVAVNGADVGDVEGWHFLDYGRPAHGGPEEWTEADGDGAFSGLPRFTTGRRPVIVAGDNAGNDLILPKYDEDGAAFVYDEDEVNAAIRRAADRADHGPPPSVDMIPTSARRRAEVVRTVYVADADMSVRAIEISRARAFRTGDGWLLTGYLVEGTEAVYETEAEAVEAVEGDRYDDEADAEAAIAERLADAAGLAADAPAWAVADRLAEIGHELAPVAAARV